jgi:hypothetical protein
MCLARRQSQATGTDRATPAVGTAAVMEGWLCQDASRGGRAKACATGWLDRLALTWSGVTLTHLDKA